MNLNRRITIERQATTVDAVGQPATTWSPLVSVWASVMHMSGYSTIKSDADTEIVRASIRIRYRTDVTAAMRVIFGQNTYLIDAVLPDAGGQKFTDLVCRRVR